MLKFLFFTVLFIHVVQENSMVTAIESTCSVTKETLTCNYIPKDIPDGIVRVNIKDFMLDKNTLKIHNELFQSRSWENVKYLRFADNSGSTLKNFYVNSMAFKRLEKLKSLTINCNSVVHIDTDGLSGIENVNMLDFSVCTRLRFNILVTALNGSEKVPNLEKLVMSQLQYFWQPGLTIDRKFSQVLSDKRLATLDLSRTNIAYFDWNIITDLKYLKVVNLSRASIDDAPEKFNFSRADLNRLEVDFSYSMAHGIYQPFESNTYANIDFQFVNNTLNRAAFLSSPRISNFTGINYGSNVLLYNIKVSSVDKIRTLTSQSILKQNKIQRFDAQFDCDNLDFSSIKYLDLAENGLEYFHPSVFSCLTSLEHLDFSVNNLNAMQNENVQLFSQLLKDTGRLQYINLSSNLLSTIPVDFFEGSENLVAINLAGNGLNHVHFKLHHLKSLTFIDLSRNNIRIFDSITMNQFDKLKMDLDPNIVSTGTNIKSSDSYSSSNLQVLVKDNPFTCNTCETLSSVRWLVNSEIIEQDELTCKSERDTNISLTDAVDAVEAICERKTKIIVITITSVVVSLICVGVVLILYFKRKRARKQRRRCNVIELLTNEEGRFAVFLSYSKDDDEFVMENVIEPLNGGLQKIVGTEKNLVCLGDAEFRPGQYVHNESLRCIELCSVVLCVVSDSYCRSNYCIEEFNQATQRTTPVILMMKGDVDIDLMTPAMQLLFRNQVRMLWEDNNGEYRLKTSWENVCESIIDIAAN